MLAALGYVVVRGGTVAIVGMIGAPGSVKGWRAGGWLLCLAVFVIHFASERRRLTARLGRTRQCEDRRTSSSGLFYAGNPAVLAVRQPDGEQLLRTLQVR